MSNANVNGKDWSGEDADVAQSQGWDIFETNRDPETEKQIVNGKPYGHRPYELQRDDEQSIFADDQAAQAFVLAAARKGDAVATRALDFLMMYSPWEHQAIVGEIQNSMTVFHTGTYVDREFDRAVGAEYAVAYCYCEANQRLPELFSHAQAGTLADMLRQLPMAHVLSFVSCGDWMVKAPMAEALNPTTI